MTRSASKLAAVLLSLELIAKKDTIEIIRLRPGHWQRSAGAWSWVAVSASTGRDLCGSQLSVREILSAEKVVVYVDRFGDVSLYAGKADDKTFIGECGSGY